MSPAPRTVVVGAGLAGLSAAMHLLAAGRAVTVLERDDRVGGLARGCDVTGASGARYRLDTGPTVMTMPATLAQPFAALGERFEDHVPLTPLDPAYRAHFADGTHLDLTSDVEAMADRIARLAGDPEAAGYRRLVRWLRALHDAELKTFIDAQMGSATTLLGRDLARVVRLGGFDSMQRRVARHLRDERLQRCFTFQALYAGLAPRRARAIYSVITYLDLVAGVSYPPGGMHALPEAMASVAQRYGARLETGITVTGLRRAAGRVVGVRAGAREWACDELVLATDAVTAHRLLGRDAGPLADREHSPSCVVLAAGLTSAWTAAPTVHHSMHFGAQWDAVFDDLADGRLMRDPSWLLSMPSASDPGAAPDGGHVAYVLFPVPHLKSGLDWRTSRSAYQEHILRTVESRYPGFRDALDATVWLTPDEWAARDLPAGTPFSAAHTVRQTGPWRTPNTLEPGVVLAGADTTPGVGVPMVVISGRLAAERLTRGTR